MSSMSPVIKYQLDLTGKSPNNLVHDEIHKLKPAMNRVLVPKYGCFFTTTNMKLRDVETGYILKPEIDYKPIMFHADATDRMGQEVCGGIVITNPAVSDHVAFTHQLCGGEYIKITELLVELIQNLNLDNRTILWGDLLGKPHFYKAGPHLHDIGDTYGWEYVVEAIHTIRDAIYKGDEASHDHIYQVIDILRALVIGNKDELDETLRLIELRQASTEGNTDQRFLDVLELINQNKDIFDGFVTATDNNFDYVIKLINQNKGLFDDHVAHTLSEFVSVRTRMDGIDQRHNGFVNDVYNTFVQNTNENFVVDRKRMDNMDVRYNDFEQATLDGFREDRDRMDNMSSSSSSVTDKINALMGPGAIVRDEEGNLVFGDLSEMLAVKTKAARIDSDLSAFKEKLNKVNNYSREDYDQRYVLATGDEVKGQIKIRKALDAGHKLVDSQLLLQGAAASDVSLAFVREGTTSTQLRHSGEGLILSGATRTTQADFRATGKIITEVGFGKESDKRLKSDIRQIKGALDKVLSVRGTTYMKQNKDEREAGVIAQEIMKILPEAVFADKNGYLIVSYESIIPLLIEAVRNLNDKIVKLEAK